MPGEFFGALLSGSPSRKPMPIEEAISLIEDEPGIHFDPTIVDSLLANLARALVFHS